MDEYRGKETAADGERVRRRVLLPISLTLLFFLGLFIFFARAYLLEELDRELQREQELVEELYEEFLDQRSSLFLSFLQQAEKDPELRQAMRDRDRPRLLKLARDFSDPLFAQGEISHFYFHDPQGVNFLRVHQPGSHGDLITRDTMVQARETLRPRSGIELGPLGTFTLRVVFPWFAEGQLIGYLEAGEEIEYLLRRLASMVQFQFLVTLEKEFLQRQGWEEGMLMVGRQGDWGRYPERVLVESTLPELSPHIEQWLQQEKVPTGTLRVESADRHLLGSFLPLRDSSERVVGNILFLRDISESLREFHRSVAITALYCLALGGALLVSTALVLGKVDRQLAQARRRLQEEVVKTRGINEELRQEIVTRHRAEAALAQARDDLEVRVAERTAELTGILRSVEDVLFAVDPQGRMLLMNASAEAFFGVSLAEAHGKKVKELPLDPALTDQVLGALRGKQACHFDYQQPGGEWQAGPILQARGSVIGEREHFGGLVFLLQDVTEERKMDRLKSEFITTAAHELRTPMTTILGYSELLLDHDPFGEEERREFLGLIYEKAEAISLLLDDLLDISRIESGRSLDLNRKSHSVRELFEGAIEHYRKLGKRHQFEVALEEPDLALVVDRSKIGQVMENLLSNAVKYSPAGGLIRVEGKHVGGDYQVCVRDRGIGLKPDQISRVFQKFYRADHSDTAVEGTGLGLTIVRHIIEAHGGRVWIESRYGEGTTVYFLLPAAQAPTRQVSPAAM